MRLGPDSFTHFLVFLLQNLNLFLHFLPCLPLLPKLLLYVGKIAVVRSPYALQRP